MSNKKKFTFLSAGLIAMLILGACTQTPTSQSKSNRPNTDTSIINNSSSSDGSTSFPVSSSQNDTSSEEHSSSSSSSSIEVVTKHTVKFVVNGTTVQTTEVEDGEVAIYEGTAPTKSSSDPNVVYRFVGWDKDITQPITADTTFNAVFEEHTYANELMVDDFETYEDTPTMMDEGWVALAYSNATGTWTTETAAAVSLSSYSEEGNKSLRFDAWENGVGYKFAKLFEGGEFTNSGNALRFKLKVPSINTLKVLLHARVTIAGSVQSPSFTYTIKPTSSEFVEYTIPLAADGWALWNEAGKTIKTCAEWMGVHEDDILNYLTRIEFYVQGNDNGNGLPYAAFLDSVKFVTIDTPAYTEQENLTVADRYTATLTDGNILRVDINGNNATASVINLETPITVNGTVAVNGKNFTFTSSALTYEATITNGGQLLKYKSATGQLASSTEDVDLLAVQVVDNYEQYATDGKAYYQSGAKDERSGCRGAYYSEYYAGSGSSPWGGNGWQLMGGDGSQLKLKQDAAGAHSGNNYLCVKHAKDKAMRYMQWGLFDGTSEKNSFRGSKLGFWARSNGWVQTFKVYMYSQNAPTNATKDQYVKSYQFTETEAISNWKHYEIELNPNVVYYGFMILVEKNYSLSGNEAYLYIDDVEVYGANPYAHYEEPEPEAPFSFKTGLSYNAKINGLIQAILTPGANNTVTLSAPGLGLTVNGTYTVESKEVTMSLDGGVTYIVEASEDGYNLAFKSVNGTGTVAQALNGLSFDMFLYGDTAESYASAGTMYYQGNTDEKVASGARGAYYCDYYTGSGSSPLGGSGWNLMGGSGDQLTLDTDNYYEGKQSLKMKKSTAGAMRYIQWDLFKGTARPITGANKFVVYLKNQATTDTVMKVYVYTAQQINANNQTTARIAEDITLTANQDWTKYEIALDPTQTYYGYGVYLAGASAVGWINVDGAMFYGPDNDANLNFYAKKDLVLKGTTTAGEATLKFGENGDVVFTCEGLGTYNVTYKYSMNMNGANQELTITANGILVKGTYSVSITGAVTFTVTNAEGDIAPYLPVDTVFSNQ